MKKLNHDEAREKDVQALCKGVLEKEIHDADDSGSWCPFCLANCHWRDTMDMVNHEPNCIYLIAKDLATTAKGDETK